MHEFTRVETNVNQKLKFSSTHKSRYAVARGCRRARPRIATLITVTFRTASSLYFSLYP